jgi:hypothetical protein
MTEGEGAHADLLLDLTAVTSTQPNGHNFVRKRANLPREIEYLVLNWSLARVSWYVMLDL